MNNIALFFSGTIIFVRSKERGIWCRAKIIELIPVQNVNEGRPCGPTKYRICDIARMQVFLTDFGHSEVLIVSGYGSFHYFVFNVNFFCIMDNTGGPAISVMILMMISELGTYEFQNPQVLHLWRGEDSPRLSEPDQSCPLMESREFQRLRATAHGLCVPQMPVSSKKTPNLLVSWEKPELMFVCLIILSEAQGNLKQEFWDPQKPWASVQPLWASQSSVLLGSYGGRACDPPL